MRVLIKGAGDLATGIAWRLRQCGFLIAMTEISKPTAVRRTVAFSQAVYQGSTEVEGITARLARDGEEMSKAFLEKVIPVLVDPACNILKEFRPDVLIDAVVAKRNLGTSMEDAPLVIGIGPGFFAGRDCHYVVETKRGHFLGRVIERGTAISNTGLPGEVGGFSMERLIRAQEAGVFQPLAVIGERVEEGDTVAFSKDIPIKAQMAGMIRGMLPAGIEVVQGMKCGDIDSRCELSHCYTISDKARSIGGGVLEAILRSTGAGGEEVKIYYDKNL